MRICAFLYNSDFTPCPMSEDIEFVWSYFSNLIRDALPHFIPSTAIKSNSQPVQFNPDIRHHINCLCTLRRKFINNPTECNKNKLDSSQAKNYAKTNYETNLITTVHITILKSTYIYQRNYKNQNHSFYHVSKLNSNLL